MAQVQPTGRDPDAAFGRLVARGLAREADASGNACPDADLLAAWYDHTLSVLEGERIEAHVADCVCCQQILAALARSEPEVIRAAPLPAPARAWHWHWRWAVPLATAVVVVVVGTRTLRAPGPGTPPPAAPATQMARVQPPEPANATATADQVPAADKRMPSPRERQLQGRVAEKNAPPVEPDQVVTVRTVKPSWPASPIPPPPPPPARAEAAPAAAPTAAPSQVAAGIVGGVTPAKPEGQLADAARRQADKAEVAREKMTKAPTQAAVPPAFETVGVTGAAPLQIKTVPAVKQASVVASAASGSTVLWRFGQDGAIDKSSDRGVTWERQLSGVTAPLADASAPADSVCWIVGARGVVLRTTDGRTWQRLNAPAGTDLVSVHAWSELAATVIASDGAGYETADGGKSWTRRR